MEVYLIIRLIVIIQFCLFMTFQIIEVHIQINGFNHIFYVIGSVNLLLYFSQQTFIK